MLSVNGHFKELLKNLRDYILIKLSRSFDERFYLKRYPDCRRADIDPVWHFVKWGWRERRDPSPEFSTSFYLSAYPDVDAARINPLVHYIRFGKKEGRLPRVSAVPQAKSCSNTMISNKIRHFAYHIAYRIYSNLPRRVRNELIGFFIRRLAWVMKWLLFGGETEYGIKVRSPRFGSIGADLVDLRDVEVAVHPGRVVVHLHLFYEDLLQEMLQSLKAIDFQFDLMVSTRSDLMEKTENALRHLENARNIVVREVENRGRNIYPFLYLLGDVHAKYDYVLHIHTKKSAYNKGATNGWRPYLLAQLLGDPQRVRKIITLLERGYGIVYPQTHWQLPYWAHTWLANEGIAKMASAKIGIRDLPTGYFDYPVGAMFWARTDALRSLFEANFSREDFPEEQGQTDGTLAHALERLFTICVKSRGFPVAVLADPFVRSWSRWRLDQYLSRSIRSVLSQLEDQKYEAIIFDVFDTLLQRPLLDPKLIRQIVGYKIEKLLGTHAKEAYLMFRGIAEEKAREVACRDVSIQDIYLHLRQLTSLSSEELESILQIELEVEQALVSTHPVGLSLYAAAKHTGKPILIASDMFLPSEVIAQMLKSCGYEGWNQLWVSGEVGVRKDTGEMFAAIATAWNIPLERMLIVGDNERSDVQIPCDLGMGYVHIMRPLEIAKGLPRWEAVMGLAAHSDTNSEITLGLILNKLFSTLDFENISPADLLGGDAYIVGYCLVGPVISCFAHWIMEQSKLEEIEHLLFLSREGRIIKDVFDIWTKDLNYRDRLKTDYLVVSRRCVTVAAIRSFEDIVKIAKMETFPTTLSDFLMVRYGLAPTLEQWHAIHLRTGLSKESIIEHEFGKIEYLIPVLEILEEDIYSASRQEREGLLAYLGKKGIDGSKRCAVVDIGYGGTVQYTLSELLGFQLQGLYMMTDFRAEDIRKLGYKLKGFFCEDAVRIPHAHVFYKYSFEVEKLMSVNEPQIVCYLRKLGGSSDVIPVYQDETITRSTYSHHRDKIQQGALDFTRDAVRIRDEVIDSFVPSRNIAELIGLNFFEKTSPNEKRLLNSIPLDDLYCGRGIVS